MKSKEHRTHTYVVATYNDLVDRTALAVLAQANATSASNLALVTIADYSSICKCFVYSDWDIHKVVVIRIERYIEGGLWRNQRVLSKQYIKALSMPKELVSIDIELLLERSGVADKKANVL